MSWQHFSGCVLALLALNTAGCKRQRVAIVDTEVDSLSLAPASELSPRVSDALEEKAAQVVETDVPLLAHGEHMVYGIRMPLGMLPIRVNDKVKRFEGTHSILAVKQYIVEQIAGNVEIQPTRMGEGFFVSNAIPKSSQRDLSNIDHTARKYNIKIFEGSLGGAGVEIWEAIEEEAPDATSSVGNGSAYQNLMGHPSAAARKKSIAPKIKLETRWQRERATFSVFEKMGKGAPLSEEDYQSPFFTDM